MLPVEHHDLELGRMIDPAHRHLRRHRDYRRRDVETGHVGQSLGGQRWDVLLRQLDEAAPVHRKPGDCGFGNPPTRHTNVQGTVASRLAQSFDPRNSVATMHAALAAAATLVALAFGAATFERFLDRRAAPHEGSRSSAPELAWSASLAFFAIASAGLW